MSLSVHTTVHPAEMAHPISLLLSKKTYDECSDCAESFLEHNIKVYLSPHNGETFLNMLGEKRPDVALLEVFMPGLDALEVKKAFGRNGGNGKTVFHATGPFYNDNIIKELIDNGFAYYLMKPFYADALSGQICRSVLGEAWKAEPVTDIQKATQMLRELGMPAHLLGFQFVRQAIGLVLENPARYGSGTVTRRLYPDVAEQNKTTASRVERAIRHAVEVSFDRGSMEVIADYFGTSVCSTKGKATNSEFIATVIDRITVERMTDNRRTATTAKRWF